MMTERVAPDAESVLTAALEQAVDAVVVVDAAERIIFCNAAAARLWGCRPARVLGEPLRQHLPGLAVAAAASEAVPTAGPSDDFPVEPIAVHGVDGSGAATVVSRVRVGGKTIYMAPCAHPGEAGRRGNELQLLSLAADETDRVVMITNAERQIVYVNAAFTWMFGYTRSQVMGRTSQQVFVGKHTTAEVLAHLTRRVDSGIGFHEELAVRDKAGRDIWIHCAVNPILDEAGRIRNIVVVMANITESKLLQLLQRDVLEAVAADMPLRAVTRLICERVEAMAPEVVCSILSVDAEKRLQTLASPSLPPSITGVVNGLAIGPGVGACGTAAYRGVPVVVADIETDPLFSGFKAQFLPHGLRACWSTPIKLRGGGVAGTFAIYYREPRGPSPWHEQVVSACVHLCVLAIERHAAKEHIARLAHYDALTGLPNRANLHELIRECLRAQARPRDIAFLFLDIDRFKDINDTLGHGVGDRLLVEVSHRLKRQLGPRDVISRHGGDEFVMVLPETGSAQAGAMAARMIEQLLAPVVIENMLLPISASIGICVYPADGADEDTLLKHADTAMHEAKGAGGGTFRFFSPEMNGLAQERLVLGTALRDAIGKRQLRLHYQPQINACGGGLNGVEALARWTHPVFGEVSPGRFIALAEECGLIEAIGQWALNEACRQLAAWLRAGLEVPCVSVNLSAVHFRNSELTGLVADTLGRHGLEPSRLTIEITEGVMMDDNPTAIDTAKAIHKLGVRLSLDDFGTGYSSLSYLARLPIDELKIDRSFMRDLESDCNSQAVVTAVVKIGQSLGLTVVAEGVETRAQQRFLEPLNCDTLQGFLFSRARAPGDFERWYKEYAADRRELPLSGAA